MNWLRAHPSIIRVSSLGMFTLIWEIAGRSANPLFLSPPSAIFQAFLVVAATGELPQALAASLLPFCIGLTISIVGGIAIGVLLAHFWFVEFALDVFLNALYAVPRVALVPLIILWAGLELAGKITIIVSIAIFPVIINTFSGIRDVRSSLLEIGRAYCANEWQIFIKITMPASLPYVMAGIRLAVGLAIIAVVVAEFFTAATGLGGLIVRYANSFATAKLFVPIIVLGIMGASLTQLTMYIEKRLSSWRISEKSKDL
jgi:ABC-type nitrate/sulfonate/bicarbonate transport system permease component